MTGLLSCSSFSPGRFVVVFVYQSPLVDRTHDTMETVVIFVHVAYEGPDVLLSACSSLLLLKGWSVSAMSR